MIDLICETNLIGVKSGVFSFLKNVALCFVIQPPYKFDKNANFRGVCIGAFTPYFTLS